MKRFLILCSGSLSFGLHKHSIILSKVLRDKISFVVSKVKLTEESDFSRAFFLLFLMFLYFIFKSFSSSFAKLINVTLNLSVKYGSFSYLY